MIPKRIPHPLYKYRFEIQTILLTWIVFGGAFMPQLLYDRFILPIDVVLLSINTLLLVQEEKRQIRFVFSGIAIAAGLLFLIRTINHQQRELQIGSLLIAILFFSILSYEVFRQMLLEKTITRNIIIAAFDCYLLLGLLGAMLFTLMLLLDPSAFSNVGESEFVFDKMLYFSLITLTSIGYGDISPLTPIAEKGAAFFGLIGHFYSVVIVGIMVGKYVAIKNQ